MASTDARPVPKKNTAYRHYFAIRKNDGKLITTWAGQDSKLSQDGGNYADATNEATEVQTSGTGYIDLTAGEMNYDCVTLKVTVTNTDALPYVVNLFPEEAGDIRANVPNLTVQAGTTLIAGSHTPQTGDSYNFLVTNLGANGINASAVGIVSGSRKLVAQDVWKDAVANYVLSSGTMAKLILDAFTKVNYLPSVTAGQAGGVFIAGDNAATTVDITGNLSGSVGSVTGGINTSGGTITTLDQLSDQIDCIDAGSGSGSNTIQFEITDDGTSALLENATITLRLNGLLKASGTTLATGRLTGNGLAVTDTGTYELAVTCDGYNGYTADYVVTAGENTLKEIDLAALSFSTPVDEDQVTGWAYTYDADGVLEASRSLYIQQVSPGSRNIYSDTIRLWTSNSGGVASGTVWADGSTYRISEDQTEWSGEFTPEDDGAGTYRLPGYITPTIQ